MSGGRGLGGAQQYKRATRNSGKRIDGEQNLKETNSSSEEKKRGIPQSSPERIIYSLKWILLCFDLLILTFIMLNTVDFSALDLLCAQTLPQPAPHCQPDAGEYMMITFNHLYPLICPQLICR